MVATQCFVTQLAYAHTGLLACADVNGCASNNCDPLTTCSDVAATSDVSGSDYTCSACPSGYAGDGVTGCSDIDDCVGNPCGSAGKCTNYIAGSGKWQCACDLGYQSIADDKDVTDQESDFFTNGTVAAIAVSPDRLIPRTTSRVTTE